MTSPEPRVRLDRNLDGSADVYAVADGDEKFILTMTADEVREFRHDHADDRIPDPAQDN